MVRQYQLPARLALRLLQVLATSKIGPDVEARARVVWGCGKLPGMGTPVNCWKSRFIRGAFAPNVETATLSSMLATSSQTPQLVERQVAKGVS